MSDEDETFYYIFEGQFTYHKTYHLKMFHSLFFSFTED